MKEENHCKYCYAIIPNGCFCCENCFDEFDDDDYYDQETEYEDWDN